MRDLAQRGLIKRRRRINRGIFKLLLLVVVAGGILFLVKSKISGDGVRGGAIILGNAPFGLTPVTLDGTETVSAAGKLARQSARFDDVMFGGSAKATATRTYGGGVFVLTVQATLPEPKGNRYQVWLVDGDDVFDGGFMNGSGTSWNVTFRNDRDFSTYGGIWITKEITTEDNEPEQKVLVGSF